MSHGTSMPCGASFEVRDYRATTLGNASGAPTQTLQGNVLIRAEL
jgi:hypothetical protein